MLIRTIRDLRRLLDGLPDSMPVKKSLPSTNKLDGKWVSEFGKVEIVEYVDRTGEEEKSILLFKHL